MIAFVSHPSKGKSYYWQGARQIDLVSLSDVRASPHGFLRGGRSRESVHSLCFLQCRGTLTMMIVTVKFSANLESILSSREFTHLLK